MKNNSGNKSQLDKFKEAARELETDDDKQRFEERLRRVVKQTEAEGKRGERR